MRVAGFTLVELVVTIAILAIVAAVAAPRFFQASTFDSRGFYDKSTAIRSPGAVKPPWPGGAKCMSA